MRQQTCTTVTLRQRPIRNGRISLYLDYYPAVRNPKTMQLSRREYLGFYIYATPKNAIELDYNNEILAKAELIRCRRQEAVINEEFGFMDRHKMRADFMAYFKEVCRKKDHKWHIVYLHFEKFVNGKCMFGEITVDLCNRFRDYLLHARQLKHTDKMVSRNSLFCPWIFTEIFTKITITERLFQLFISRIVSKSYIHMIVPVYCYFT